LNAYGSQTGHFYKAFRVQDNNNNNNKKEMVFRISLVSLTTSSLMNIPLLHIIATDEAYVLQKEKDGTFYGLGDCSMLVNSLSTPMSGQKKNKK
jgi:hypothetical protein